MWARWELMASLEGPQMSRRINEVHPERFKYSKPYSNRCFHPGLTCLLGWRVGSSDPPWHGACNHPESLFGCLRSHKAGKWIVWPRKGKMKEKENEITDLADCTNHAYHVLWLARRIQHLWITVAIIVHEYTGRGWEERLRFVCRWIRERECARPGRCLRTRVCFSWHGPLFGDRGEMIKESYGNACCSVLLVHPGRAARSPQDSLAEASFTIVITLFIYPTCFWW